MIKVVSINLGNYGSTGRIMIGISKTAQENGFDSYNAYPKSLYSLPSDEKDIIISSSLINRINQKLSLYTGLNGCFAIFSTLHFLSKLNNIKPDILHFHNLHNSYINLPLLFRYVKKHHIRVVWTLHDCWAFTGHCPHFMLCNCDKWKTGCGDCPQTHVYPATIIDTTHFMWKRKKTWFTGVEDMTIVTPSKWLASLVKQSFLSEYPVVVINNGIDLCSFKPTSSSFREEYGFSPRNIQ